jgi:hypothetical protein
MRAAGSWILAALLALAAEGGELRLTWSELQAWTGPQARVKILTGEGVWIEARLERVEEDRLALAVLKSSDPSRYAKGQTILERTAVQRIAVRRESKTARTGLAIFGAVLFGPLMAAGGAQGYSEGSQVVNAVVSASIVFGLLGYLWGRSIDNKWTDVILTPAGADTITRSPEPDPASPRLTRAQQHSGIWFPQRPPGASDGAEEAHRSPIPRALPAAGPDGHAGGN